MDFTRAGVPSALFTDGAPVMFPTLLLTTALSAAPAPTPPDESLKLDERDLPGISIFSDRRRRRTAGSAHKLSEKTLQRQGHDDIHRILGQVPGVYVREEEGYGLRPNIGLRGASSDRSAKVTLMEDGLLLGPAPYSAPAAYYFPIASRLVGVEVYKGPAAVQFGPQTIGGRSTCSAARSPSGVLRCCFEAPTATSVTPRSTSQPAALAADSVA